MGKREYSHGASLFDQSQNTEEEKNEIYKGTLKDFQSKTLCIIVLSAWEKGESVKTKHKYGVLLDYMKLKQTKPSCK